MTPKMVCFEKFLNCNCKLLENIKWHFVEYLFPGFFKLCIRSDTLDALQRDPQRRGEDLRDIAGLRGVHAAAPGEARAARAARAAHERVTRSVVSCVWSSTT